MKSVQIRSFFWSLFSLIRTEYGEKLRTSPYSVRMREDTDQKKLRIWTHFTQCKLLYQVIEISFLATIMIIFYTSIISASFINPFLPNVPS